MRNSCKLINDTYLDWSWTSVPRQLDIVLDDVRKSHLVKLK